MVSAKEQIACEDHLLDPFVENFVLEIKVHFGDGVSRGGRQTLEWRASIAKHFIEEWEWQLSILPRLLSLSERQRQWKEALTVLRPAPSKLLNLCMQRAKYDSGEGVHRFSLSAEDKAEAQPKGRSGITII
ncbi:hypothetical protein PRUPE_5G099400 [Prunus persica]|uniref:Uncharacterized protein n=1 Tax=Prunus persica TaxID=3760 RepID=A0A251P673_PRUPE|nr:uncharacterized protein LOC109949245 [Prunus persica]ONI07088.1 hypothetical protein PRUPE_5G099400 [Prunus persica]